jgi:hypothetical protein
MTEKFEIEISPKDQDTTKILWEKFNEFGFEKEVIVSGVRVEGMPGALEDNRTSTFGVKNKDIRTTHYLSVYNPFFYATIGIKDDIPESGFRGLFIYDPTLLIPVGTARVLWRHSLDEPVNNAIQKIIEIKLAL